MDIYEKAISDVTQFVEKEIAKLGSQRDANVKLKQATYKQQTTDKLIANITAERDEAISKLTTKYNEDVKTINLGYENKKTELIEKGNALVKAEEDCKYELGVSALREIVQKLKAIEKEGETK